MVVLSDGRDNQFFAQSRQSGRASEDPRFQAMLAAIRETRIPVYFVALNTDKNPDSFYNAPDSFLREVRNRMELTASASGGRIFFPNNIRDIVQVYDQVSRDLSTSYGLAYISTHGNVRGQYHKIDVRVHRADATVRQFRDGYTTP